jgi:hypothetical protein
MRYEPPAINFHLGKHHPENHKREGKHTECAATTLIELVSQGRCA